MSTQLEIIQCWDQGVKAALQGDFDKAMEAFEKITDPRCYVLFDMGTVCLRKGSFRNALKHFDLAVKKDQHLAVGYFQRAIVKHKQREYQAAQEDFEKSFKLLRGNKLIDYKQMGMPMKLYSSEVLYNQGLNYIFLGDGNKAKKTLELAIDNKMTAAHDMADKALAAAKKGDLFDLYMLPSEGLFKPPAYKTEVIGRSSDYMGSAKVLSSWDQDKTAGFEGAKRVSPVPFRRAASPGTISPLTRSPLSSPKPSPKLESHLTPGRTFKAIYEFTPSTDQEMAMTEGDAVLVTEQGSDGWYRGTNSRTHESGLVPESYLQEILRKRSAPPTLDSDPVRNPRPISPTSRSKSPATSAFKPTQKGGFKAINKPPSPRTSPVPGRKSPMRIRKSPYNKEPYVVVKMNYMDTRAIEIASGTSLEELTARAKRKFNVEDKAMSLWREDAAHLVCIETESAMQDAWRSVTGGYLTLWLYEEKTGSSGNPYLYEVETLYDYDAQQVGDLGFRAGDIIQVTVEVSEEWMEGRSRGNMGIFPKSFVRKV